MKLGKKARIRNQLRARGGNPRELAACYGKIRYDSYQDAKVDAENAVNAHAYKCPYCKKYHKGRKPKD